MKWHTNVTIGDLHYLRSKFAVDRGFDVIYLSSFNRATEVFYYNKQFATNGDFFLTWAFLNPEWEVDYLLGGMNWLFYANDGNPWVIEAYMPKMSLSAMRELKPLIPEKTLRFKLENNKPRRINLP